MLRNASQPLMPSSPVTDHSITAITATMLQFAQHPAPRDAPCYRHRYLAILWQRSVSTDRQRSMMSIRVALGSARTNPGRCPVCSVSTMLAALG
jgi:hypothetical protein